VLKTQIQSVINGFNSVKLIAFPWESLDIPVAMTSWGQLQEFEVFNEALAATFVDRNRNWAPEPNAPLAADFSNCLVINKHRLPKTRRFKLLGDQFGQMLTT
jgi:hypothetical protein